MTELSIGGNKKLEHNNFTLHHNFDNTIDLSVFFLQSNSKVEGDSGMIFYGQPRSSCGAVHIKNGTIEFNLNHIPKHITKLSLTATVDNGNFSNKNNFKLYSDEFSCPINTSERQEAALILIELYLHNNAWKVKYVLQGFNGGLQPLAEHFGVDITDEPPVVQLTPPVSSVNLSKGKISLTKNDKPVIIEKTEHITATVSWKSGTDYDIYALVMLKSGEQIAVATFGADGVPPLQNYGNGKISHRGDIKGSGKSGGLFGMFSSKSQEEDNTEIIDMRLSDDIIAVVPIAYSAQSNGTGSFYRYKVSLAINNGVGTSVEVSAENANNDKRIYTCVPGIIYNTKEGVQIQYLEHYSAKNSENRPQLRLNSDQSVDVIIDAGPKNHYK